MRVERVRFTGARGGKMLVFCERGDITPPPTPGFQLKVQALGVIPPIENVSVAKKLPPWHIVVFDGAVVKRG